MQFCYKYLCWFRSQGFICFNFILQLELIIQFALICFDCVLQLKLVTHVTFHFNPYSFNIFNKITPQLFLKNNFICFGPMVFICFNFVLRFKLIIYFIFHFGHYSLNFLFAINIFGFFYRFFVNIYFLSVFIHLWF